MQLWSTKTVTADWQMQVEHPIISRLQPEGEQLVAGEIENHTGVLLEDALLLYGNWAYYLGRISPSGITTIDSDLQPRTVKTTLTSATAGDETEQRITDDGTVPFSWGKQDVARLVKAMMFFKAINGEKYTQSVNRYCESIDLSHLLEQQDLAILVARMREPGSRWLHGDEPLGSEEDLSWIYYRFVLPVENAEE